MKTMGLVLCLVIAAAACAVVGCDDRDVEGSDAGGVSDDVFTVYGDVEPDESPPGDSKQEFGGKIPDNLDPMKVCTPYLGIWHCVCEEGQGSDCSEGKGDFRSIKFLSVTDHVMNFAVEILPIDDNSIVFICDPANLPVTDVLFGASDLEFMNDTTMKWITKDPFSGSSWTMICTFYTP